MSAKIIKCASCGSTSVKYDAAKAAYFCDHCGSVFVVEKKTSAKVNNEIDSFLNNGDAFLKIADYNSALACFKRATVIDASDWRGWFGLAACYSKRFTVIPPSPTDYDKAMKNAYSFADEVARKHMQTVQQAYRKRIADIQLTEDIKKRNTLVQNASILSNGIKEVAKNALPYALKLLLMLVGCTIISAIILVCLE